MEREWGEYVPVNVRHSKAKREMNKLRKQGQDIKAVKIQGKEIAKHFWGKKWCDHIENFADYDNRLPRGRTYVRNGSIYHLDIQEGKVEAIVSGSKLYDVIVTINPLAKDKWESIKNRCNGYVASLLDLLQGKISDHVMEIVSDDKSGLFPGIDEMHFKCSCSDWAGMCKHVAAVLYGIANRLDNHPELLFQLRGVHPQELVSLLINLEKTSPAQVFEKPKLSGIFSTSLQTTEPILPTDSVKKNEEKAKSNTTISKQTHASALINIDTLTGVDIMKLRLQKKLSVVEFAKELGVSTSSIYRWESCKTTLKLRNSSKSALKNTQ